jgi:CheY-like chemotaxis protein
LKTETTYILLADDDEGDRLLFTEALEELQLNLKIDTVNNGMELMAYLTNTDAMLPQLIFLDLNMPRKNGIECLKEIRINKIFNDIFIAIYSTSNAEKDIEETFLNGANIYINKPADFTTLKKTLEKAVSSVLQYKNGQMNRDFFLLKI